MSNKHEKRETRDESLYQASPNAVRPMPASSLARVKIEGPAGAIETDVNDPGGARRGIALIAQPNPLHGGT